MKIQNRTTFFLFLAFALANLVDGITALFISDAESNPLYLLFGNFWLLMILKIVMVVAMGYYTWRNIYPTNFMYYLTIMILLLGTLLVGLGASSNIYGMMNPEVIEEGAEASVQEKVKGYSIFITVIYVIPVIFNIIIFLCYDLSYNKAIIDKEFFKKLKWWKL